MSKWSKTEKELWDKNETLKSFEDKIKEAAFDLSKIITAQTVSGKIQQAKKDLTDLNKSVTEVSNNIKKNFADDGKDNSFEKENLKSLISELKNICDKMIDTESKHNVYILERAIEELEQILSEME